jgi:hypothetical protein
LKAVDSEFIAWCQKEITTANDTKKNTEGNQYQDKISGTLKRLEVSGELSGVCTLVDQEPRYQK